MNTVARSDLQIMADKIGDLPLLPQVLVSILQLRVDSDNYFEDFGKLTKKDPAFAVKLTAWSYCPALGSSRDDRSWPASIEIVETTPGRRRV